MKVYGDHTYDIYAHLRYKEILLAIEDSVARSGNVVEKINEKKSDFELLREKHE